MDKEKFNKKLQQEISKGKPKSIKKVKGKKVPAPKPQRRTEPPTPAEIEAEIKKLTNLAPRIKQFSIFGENNRHKIDAQIFVLKESLTEDDIYEKQRLAKEEGLNDEEFPWDDEDLISNALEAANWLEGNYETMTLAEAWEPLIQK
jgi:hypothetical protein